MFNNYSYLFPFLLSRLGLQGVTTSSTCHTVHKSHWFHGWWLSHLSMPSVVRCYAAAAAAAAGQSPPWAASTDHLSPGCVHWGFLFAHPCHDVDFCLGVHLQPQLIPLFASVSLRLSSCCHCLHCLHCLHWFSCNSSFSWRCWSPSFPVFPLN